MERQLRQSKSRIWWLSWLLVPSHHPWWNFGPISISEQLVISRLKTNTQTKWTSKSTSANSATRHHQLHVSPRRNLQDAAGWSLRLGRQFWGYLNLPNDTQRIQHKSSWNQDSAWNQRKWPIDCFDWPSKDFNLQVSQISFTGNAWALSWFRGSVFIWLPWSLTF